MNARRTRPEIDLDAEEGFAARPVTADLARRQLHMSLAIMGVIVASAVAIFSTVGLAPPRAGSELTAQLTVQQPHFVRPMTAANTTAQSAPQPGG